MHTSTSRTAYSEPRDELSLVVELCRTRAQQIYESAYNVRIDNRPEELQRLVALAADLAAWLVELNVDLSVEDILREAHTLAEQGDSDGAYYRWKESRQGATRAS